MESIKKLVLKGQLKLIYLLSNSGQVVLSLDHCSTLYLLPFSFVVRCLNIFALFWHLLSWLTYFSLALLFSFLMTFPSVATSQFPLVAISFNWQILFFHPNFTWPCSMNCAFINVICLQQSPIQPNATFIVYFVPTYYFWTILPL